jgi:hypothetical protein
MSWRRFNAPTIILKEKFRFLEFDVSVEVSTFHFFQSQALSSLSLFFAAKSGATTLRKMTLGSQKVAPL